MTSAAGQGRHTPESARPSLEAYLAECSAADQATLMAARPLSGGAIQENWLLKIRFDGGPLSGEHELVLRTDAPSRVSFSRSRAEEFMLLQAAAAAGVTVPEPLWLCQDGTVMGRPFYIMRRVAGTADPRKILQTDHLDALAERLGRELGRIHSIRPPNKRLAFLGLPEVSPALDAVAQCRAQLDALGRPFPGLEWGLRWAERYARPAGELVLTHQDFRTGNYMVHDGALTAVLDWEFCHWGDPMTDLGWFCARCWRFGRDDREAGGIAAREPFYEGYEAASGRSVDRAAVAYWEIVAHLRWAVIALEQSERAISRGEDSLELALIGRIYPPALELEILRQTAPAQWRNAE